MKELSRRITLDQVSQALSQYPNHIDPEYLASNAFAMAVEFESQTKTVNEIIAEFKRQNGIKAGA